MASVTTAVPATTSGAATTTSTAASATRTPTSSSAIAPGSTVTPMATLAYRSAFGLISVEVRLVIGEIRPAFDRHRWFLDRRMFSVPAGLRSASAHLRALLFENGFAGKSDAITLDGQHFD